MQSWLGFTGGNRGQPARSMTVDAFPLISEICKNNAKAIGLCESRPFMRASVSV